MIKLPYIHPVVPLFALSGLLSCYSGQRSNTNVSEQVSEARTLLTAAVKASRDGAVPCVVATTMPALWLSLDSVDDTGLTAEIVTDASGTVISGEGIPLLVPGVVGNTLVLDGATYVDMKDMDKVGSSPEGFSFGLWVMPSQSGQATLLSHGLRAAPGSWRLLSTPQEGIAFEFCDESQCLAHPLPGALRAGEWSYVSGILEIVLEDSNLRTLTSTIHSTKSDGTSTSSKSFPISSHFGFNITGSMVIGASLDGVPTDEEFEGPHLETTPAEMFVGAIDEVMYYDIPVGSQVLATNASAPGGLCPSCIHDVIPPEIYCPAPLSIPEGRPIQPQEVIATDNCDANPKVLTTVSNPDPGRMGDVVDVSYTAFDVMGNQSKCSTQIEVVDAPELGDPADKAIFSGGSCTLTASPATVVSGTPLTLGLSTSAFQCTNGTCDVVREYSHPVPGAYAGMANIAMTSYTWVTNVSQYGANFSSSTSSVASISYNLLQTVANTYTYTHRVYDHATGQQVGHFSCSTTVLVQPIISSYCGQSISWWNTQVVTGQIQYYNLNDPNIYTGQSWFNGSGSDDLIIGTPGHDKVRGQDGNDCIWGGAGQDKLEGGSGADRLDGSADMDQIWGGSGNDTLWGNEGTDKLYGEGESDWIYGGSGGDTIDGQAGGDRLYGEAGNDDIDGGDGVDLIYGGDNNDAIEGQGDPDTIFGGHGCDAIQGNGGGDDLLGESGGDHIWGGDGSDEILGGSERDFLTGNGGEDDLMGESGDDWMCGNAHNDDLDGGSGNDECKQNGGVGWMQCEDNSGRNCNSSFDVTGGWPCN